MSLVEQTHAFCANSGQWTAGLELDHALKTTSSSDFSLRAAYAKSSLRATTVDAAAICCKARSFEGSRTY